MNEKPVVKNVIAKCGCDKILPLAVVYILYIILHGHLSPGGGFQGGVLMAGIVCNPDAQHYARQIGVAVDEDGFLKSRDNVASITESSRPGVFFAGACTGAKTVPETLAEARSAALAIHQYFNQRS